MVSAAGSRGRWWRLKGSVVRRVVERLVMQPHDEQQGRGDIMGHRSSQDGQTDGRTDERTNERTNDTPTARPP